ncbi:MAG: endonuclease/exonuclease/phosphatase family protein [Phycisphaeraceae bacterium]|nr:endonuclease/exonuclease/phosphatase family protein [Phycisphaeraceae bacterium]MCW5754293.1 endonuclease/exonuclease/phosphatase family protein [Phycisphaeraceae bacterium]
MATIFTWNILHGGGRRTPEILLRLLASQADVLVLSEYRSSRGGGVRGVLADHGWGYQQCTDPAPGRNGLLVASRVPLGEVQGAAPPEALAGKWAMVDIPDLGFSLAGVHIPESRTGTAKYEAWAFVLDVARSRAKMPFVIAGDLNTGRTGQDEEQPVLTCSAFMGRLWTVGYRDAWRELHPDDREYSWYSHEGNGFRLDHVLVSAPLAERLDAAWYAHDDRVSGLSDHASLTVRLKGASSAGRHDPDDSSEFPRFFGQVDA